MKTKSITTIALLFSLIILSAFVSIPTPAGVPIVLQNLMIFIAVGYLGGKKGGILTVLFFVSAALGFPVLSGGRGGLALLIGPTGGYLLGYFLTPLTIGWPLEKVENRFWKIYLVLLLGGAVAINATGSLYLSYLNQMGIKETIGMFFAFLPLDAAKCIFGAIILKKIKEAERKKQ